MTKQEIAREVEAISARIDDLLTEQSAAGRDAIRTEIDERLAWIAPNA